jgi:hypothetical protein
MDILLKIKDFLPVDFKLKLSQFQVKDYFKPAQ